MPNIELNSIDDLVKVLHELQKYDKYKFEREHLVLKHGICYYRKADGLDQVIFDKLSFLTEFYKMQHVTEHSFYEFNELETSLSEKITEVQLAASAFLLDEAYNPLKKANEKLAKIGYTVFRSNMPEFGEYVLQNNEFRIYFDY